jgi:hypothetical protein
MIRFHKSFRLFPGVHLNLSKTGVSLSLGAAPLTINLGTDKTMVTTSIPGTGISNREIIPHKKD